MNIFSASSSSKKIRAAADAARDHKQWATAAMEYRRYLEVEPEDFSIWIQLGHAVKEDGNLVEAESAYRRATTLAPDDMEPRIHLAHVLKKLGRSPQAAKVFLDIMRAAPTPETFDELSALGYGSQARTLLTSAPAERTTNARYLELKDLFQYLSHHVTVTGITRVVLGLVNYILEDLDEHESNSYEFVHQFGDSEGLSLLSKPKLRRLVQLATADVGDLTAMAELVADMRRTAPLIQLKAGDVYFIPGAFWEFVANPNWLSSMKQRGVFLGAYIYDLIPITHTHYCMAELTDAFNIAFAETARVVDFTLTISKFVGTQVQDFIDANGIPSFPVVPVPLAHELHFDTEKRLPSMPSDTFVVEALDGRPFVLCVCTIEARKNHIYLFYIWQKMIDEGIDVPDLVFVGRHGWRINDLVGQIEASRYLGGRLHIMHGLSDVELASLYEKCMFTVFPSFVEGWGLPVGESLTYGKVCVASSTSSIPEVGGDLAVYVDPFNLTSGYDAIRRLILEPEYLAELEGKIRNTFVPRTWQDVGGDFFASLDRIIADLRDGKPKAVFRPRLEAGALLDMPSLMKSSLRRAEYVRNPLRLIFLKGWRNIEGTGTWMRDKTAELHVQTDYAPGREVSILIQVGMSPWVSEKNTLSVWASEVSRKRGETDGTFYYTRPVVTDMRCWIRLRGRIGADGILSISFKIDGNVETNDVVAIPVAIRLHALGFSATDDYGARMDLVEQTTLL